MVGTIKQDGEGMAKVLVTVTDNYIDGKPTFDGVDAENVVGTWRVNIPYAAYLG